MLYNKYRPKKINELVGQNNAKNFLLAVKQESPPNAVILFGPSGTGKTTSARLLAKKLYCENPTPEGDVCGVCNSCQAVEKGELLDYVEIDAASNNSVNDIRELKDKVALNPFGFGRRIIYLDEAHMLTKQAWNALLKLLEEPGRNVFILATTEVSKIPKTIRTRSIEVEFKELDSQTLAEFVRDIAKKEGYELDETFSEAIAFFSEGSPRRALVLLEQVLTQAGKKKLTKDDIKNFPFLSSDGGREAFSLFRKAFNTGDVSSYFEMLPLLPNDDSKLRPLANYMMNYALKVVSNPNSKAGPKVKKARIAFLKELSEALKYPYQPVTKPAIVKAVVSALEVLNG